MKVVKRYAEAMKAHIDRSLLESEGIECEVLGENVIYSGLAPAASFPIELVAADEDYERAKNLLSASQSAE